MTHLNSEWMTNFKLLGNIWQDAETNNSLLLRNFLFDVATSMTFAAHAQGELFGAPQVLYILNRGLVGRRACLLLHGAVWGTDFLLANPSLLEPIECFALT